MVKLWSLSMATPSSSKRSQTYLLLSRSWPGSDRVDRAETANRGQLRTMGHMSPEGHALNPKPGACAGPQSSRALGKGPHRPAAWQKESWGPQVENKDWEILDFQHSFAYSIPVHCFSSSRLKTAGIQFAFYISSLLC